MKIRVIFFSIVACLFLCACEADRSIPLFMQGAEKQVYDDTNYSINEFTDTFIAANYYRMQPDDRKEEILYGAKKGYVSLDEEPARQILEAACVILQGCYNHNFPYENQINMVKPYVSKKLFSQLQKCEVFDNRCDLFEKYNGTTAIYSIEILPYNLVSVYEKSGIETYRYWVRVNVEHSAGDVSLFKESHYVYGDLFLELYLYFRSTENEFAIVGWDEVNVSPDLEVIISELGTEENDYYLADRHPRDNWSHEDLINGYTFIDVVEFPSYLQERILTIMDDFLAIQNVKDGLDYEERVKEICTKEMATSLLNNKSRLLTHNPDISRLSNELHLYIYSKGSQEYLFATIELKHDEIDIQKRFLTCRLLPLDQGEFLIDEFLIFDAE